jgi:hypothetical protein
MEQNWLGSQLILPDLILPSRVNQCWEYSGMDCLENCADKNHFKQYPHNVVYQYNSRGFRDCEWPDSLEELKKATWCIGDSFTVGLGSPVEHTWPWLLQQRTDLRTINISMDGASNNWIARKTVDILQKINPQHLVIHWSFTSRRELDIKKVANQWWNNFYSTIRDPSWPDCKNLEDYDQLPLHIKDEINDIFGGFLMPTDEDCRADHVPYATNSDDLYNTIECINMVNQSNIDTNVIHSFIPTFSPNQIKITQYLDQHQIKYIPEFSKMDLARDGFHYDILTSQMFVDQIINRL